MKNIPLSEMSTEDLVKNKKSISTITGFLAGMLIVLLILVIHTWVTKGFTALIIIPFALSTTVFINLKKVKDIKKELKSRGQL